MSKCTKSWENLLNVEIMYEMLRKCMKCWENVWNVEKMYEMFRKCAKWLKKVRESELSVENVCLMLRKTAEF
jgi:hypothetical protein